MKDKLQDIEKLFRESFEGFEGDVDPTLWSNISSKVNAPSPSAGSSASGSGSTSAGIGGSTSALLSVAKIAAIVASIGIAGYGLYSVFSSDNDDAAGNESQSSVEVKSLPESKTSIKLEVDNSSISEEISENELNPDQEKVSINSQTIPSGHSTSQTPVTGPEALQTNPYTSEENGKTEKNTINQSDDNEAAKSPAAEPSKKEKELVTFEAAIYASVRAGKQPLEVYFENRGTYSSNVLWKFRDNTESSENSVVHTFEKSGNYWVVLEIRSEKGEVSKDSAKITVEGKAYINVPNTFSPNGDGINDAFMVESEYISDFSCKIFDRNLRLVYQWSNIYGHWDGRDMNGNESLNGIYFYLIEATDQDGKPLKVLKGNVTIFR